MSTPVIASALESSRLNHQLQNVRHYLTGAQPRHDRLSYLIRSIATVRPYNKSDVSLCIELNNIAQGIIDRADEAVNAQLADTEHGAAAGPQWNDLRAVKVQCLRLEHIFHVIEGLLGGEEAVQK